MLPADPEVLGGPQLAALLTPGAPGETFGPWAGRPAVFLEIDRAGRWRESAHLLHDLPCVTVGVASGRVPDDPPPLDVLVADAPEPPAPWVGTADTTAPLADLWRGIAAAPAAAVALVQLLRLSARVPVADAIVAESFVYSMLQSGPMFRSWLAERQARPSADRLSLRERPRLMAEHRNGVLTITLDRPERRNAVDRRLRDELVEALAVATVDPSVEEVRIRGNGPDFCSGGDLDEFGTATDPVTAHLVRTTRSLPLAVATCPARTVVELHGAAIGAGIELASFADHVIADPATRAVLPEVQMGLVPGAGGTAGLPRRIGTSRTAFLAISGRPLGAAAALRWGLVDELASAAGT